MVFSDETLTPLHGAKKFVAQTNPQAVLEAFNEVGFDADKGRLPVSNKLALSEALEQLVEVGPASHCMDLLGADGDARIHDADARGT